MLKSNLHTKIDLDAGFMALRAGLQYNIYNFTNCYSSSKPASCTKVL